MPLDEVEMCFAMKHVHTPFVLFVTIVVTDSAPLGYCYSLCYQGSLTSDLLLLVINFGLCVFCHSKLPEDIFHLMKLVQIIFHVGYGVRGVASVLCHHIEINHCPDVFESTFERNCLCASWLAKSHNKNSQNTAPQIPPLFPLPLSNLAVGLFGDQESRVWR